MNYAQLKTAWDAMLREKTVTMRDWHRKYMCRVDPKLLMRLFCETRKCISVGNKLPSKSHHGNDLWFARDWRKGTLLDVVNALVSKRRTRLNVRLSLLEWVDVGRIPNDGYYVEGRALASYGTGHGGGKFAYVTHVDSEESKFIPDVEAGLPRLKEFHSWGQMRQCVWSTRDKRLTPIWRDLKSRSSRKRCEAMLALSEMEFDTPVLRVVAQRVAEGDLSSILEAMAGTDEFAGTTDSIAVGDFLGKACIHAPQFVARFAEALQLPDPRQRRAAARCLCETARGDISSIPILLKLLEDPDQGVRIEVFSNIARIFHYGPSAWPSSGKKFDPENDQDNPALEVAEYLLAKLDREPSPEFESDVRYILNQISKWSPRLQRLVKKRWQA